MPAGCLPGLHTSALHFGFFSRTYGMPTTEGLQHLPGTSFINTRTSTPPSPLPPPVPYTCRGNIHVSTLFLHVTRSAEVVKEMVLLHNAMRFTGTKEKAMSSVTWLNSPRRRADWLFVSQRTPKSWLSAAWKSVGKSVAVATENMARDSLWI